MKNALGLIVMLLMVGGCATTPKPARKPPTLAAWEDLTPATDERVLISGQPSDDALDEFVARGGRLIINLRTDEEMAFFPYYGRSVASRGLTHVRVPTSGSTLGPETRAAVSDALSGWPSGPVLLHCASGGRATYVWAMERMVSEGISAEEAIAWAVSRRDGKAWETGAEILRGMETGE